MAPKWALPRVSGCLWECHSKSPVKSLAAMSRNGTKTVHWGDKGKRLLTSTQLRTIHPPRPHEAKPGDKNTLTQDWRRGTWGLERWNSEMVWGPTEHTCKPKSACLSGTSSSYSRSFGNCFCKTPSFSFRWCAKRGAGQAGHWTRPSTF